MLIIQFTYSVQTVLFKYTLHVLYIYMLYMLCNLKIDTLKKSDYLEVNKYLFPCKCEELVIYIYIYI